ncbi:MAG: undecaprenyl-diphosphate phosphatase [Candidatus Saccharibacteria bacterium]|nr:undecaprenyl-diphosphate phosphatase [Candidatus Saccharibacteria bacterium]
MMESWQAFWLGLTQGLAEFIPVSSSGHLEIMREILSGNSESFHLFLELINVGTLLVLLIYYRKRIMEILKEIFIEHDFKFALNIILTCIPVVVAALLLNDLIDSSPFFSNLSVIAVMMAVVGILMINVKRLPKCKKIKSEKELTPKKAIGIGIAQCFALIPGTSRSGTTILAGRVAGMDNKSAADYSFLVSIIVMTGVVVKSLLSSSSRAYIAENWGMLLFANIVAFISGLIAIKFVMKFLKKDGSLEAFGWYRVIIATLVIIFELLK